MVSKDVYLLYLLFCASVHILCVWFPKTYTYYVYSVQVCTFFVCSFQRRIPINFILCKCAYSLCVVSQDVYLLFLLCCASVHILCVFFPKAYTYYLYSVQVCIFFVFGFQRRIPIIFTLLCKCAYSLCVVSKDVYLLFLLCVSVHMICVWFPKTYIHSQHLSLWSSKLSGRSGQVRCTCSTIGNAKSLGLETAREKWEGHV